MAGRISDDDIQKVREATDIVSLISERVPLKQRGSEFWGCCPFHNEKTPSFKVDSATGLWHCFGCGEGGDLFGYVMKLDDLSFPEAVMALAEKAHIDIKLGGASGVSHDKRSILKKVCQATSDFYNLNLMRGKSQEADKARKYLSGRGLGGAIPKAWNLGFAPGGRTLINHLTSLGFTNSEMISANVAVKAKSGNGIRDRFFNRVMFPINDVSGECIAFGGRIIGEGQPKYLNSQETPIFHKSNVLYALDKAKGKMASTGEAIIAEGYTDVITMHEAGFTNTVATLGTSLTRQHIRLISRHANKRIIYLFDGDEAGQRATERALQFIDETFDKGTGGIDLLALSLPEGLDPAEYLQKYGAEELTERFQEAKPLIAFGIERRLSKHDLATSEGRRRALSDALDVLAPIKETILAKDYAVQIASELRMQESDVLQELSKLKAPKAIDDRAANSANVKGGSSKRSRVRFSLSETNRLRIERELLGQLAQEPLMMIKYAQQIEAIQWRESVHADISKAMLEKLTENLEATPSEIVAAALQASAHASRILTSASNNNEEDTESTIEYLLQEIRVSDLEEEIRALRSKMKGSDDEDKLFAHLIEMQNELKNIRR